MVLDLGFAVNEYRIDRNGVRIQLDCSIHAWYWIFRVASANEFQLIVIHSLFQYSSILFRLRIGTVMRDLDTESSIQELRFCLNR